jgi:hypothetical protein
VLDRARRLPELVHGIVPGGTVKTRDFLRTLTLKSAVGAFEFQGTCVRARAGLTPFGIVELPEASTPQEDRINEARAEARRRILDLRRQFLAWLLRRGVTPAPSDESAGSPAKVQPAVVGLRPDTVTFISEPLSADAAGRTTADRDAEKSERHDRAAILHDSIELAVGKQRFVATARVRREELDAASAAAGFSIDDGHRFEPGPWAVWRASLYHAPLKPKRGIHLRYIVGPSGGIVVLAAGDRPLAWQILAHESDKEWFDGLLHAFHVLDLFAVRRLSLPAIAHISVQGAGNDDREWDALSQGCGRPIQRVPGPPYDAHMVAFGAALGALDLKKETLNLARSIQNPPRLFSMIPWAEVGVLVVLFGIMFALMRYCVSDTRQQLATLHERAAAAAWAKGMTDAQLKKEAQALEKEVNPLKQFVSRELYFSRAFDSLSQSMPPTTWLVHLSGDDLIWEKSPNKALGQRYIIISAGAPSETEGAAPPEINEAVHAMGRDEYLRTVLPNVKLSDVNWHREAGKSYALFSVLALSRQ